MVVCYVVKTLVHYAAYYLQKNNDAISYIHNLHVTFTKWHDFSVEIPFIFSSLTHNQIWAKSLQVYLRYNLLNFLDLLTYQSCCKLLVWNLANKSCYYSTVRELPCINDYLWKITPIMISGENFYDTKVFLCLELRSTVDGKVVG